MKTFTIIGYSVLNGERKVRVANDFSRIKILIRNGHTDIELHEVEKYWPGAIVNNKDEATALLAVHSELARTLGPVGAVEKAFEVTDALAASWKDYYPTFNTVVEEEQPVFEMQTAAITTFEMALATIPMREKGRFIKREVREQMARDLMAAMA
jgi:hypothetical protein